VSLLSLEHITVGDAGEGRRGRAALRDVSLSVEAGELVAIAGPPRSGRTTLVRIAAGVVSPSAGAVRFAGADLARRPMIGAPHGIAYALTSFEPIVGGCVLEQVAAPMLARGCSMLRARAMAYGRLQRAGVAACASLETMSLGCIEALRVAVARALMTAPALLLVDDPADLPPSCEDHELLTLLRAIAHHDAIAVVLTTDRGPLPDDVDRAYRLEQGALRRLPAPAPLFPPRPRRGCAP
jgi:predicted ABC-type transport system involved in lysophospholipase L1 biosynthesis ATPase subunit